MKRKRYKGLYGHCYSKATFISEDKISEDVTFQVWGLYDNTAFLIRATSESIKNADCLSIGGSSSYVDNALFGGQLSAACLNFLHEKGLIDNPENWCYGKKEKHTGYLNDLVKRQISSRIKLPTTKGEKRKNYLLFSFQPKSEEEKSNKKLSFSTQGF